MKEPPRHINGSIANSRRFFTAGALFLCASPATLLGDTIRYYSHGDPTNLEQYQLELVNAARANPAAQAAKLGINLNQGLTPDTISTEAKQPLAFHLKLLQTAQGHSDWMLDNEKFSNIGLDSSTPTDRAKDNEYQFPVAENIWWIGTSGTLNLNGATLTTHEDLFKSPDHRPNLMNPSFSVVGLGLQEGKFQELNALMVTQNFSSNGNLIDSGPFLVGVVYDDINKNGICDPGEGIPDVRVEPDFGEYHTITSTSGGYAIPIPPIPPLDDAVEDYDIKIPILVGSTTLEDIRPYDEEFRKMKIETADEVSVKITWSSQNIGQPKQSSVTIRRPVKINYRLIGTNGEPYNNTMVTSLNVKADLQVSLPRIISQPVATQILDVGFPATLSVSATGSDLSYQWYQGVRGDISIPVGNNSPTFLISSLDTDTKYWVRVANANGSADSAESLVVVRHPGTKLYPHGDPTNLEQYQLELVNAARANPKAQADKLGVGLNEDLTPGSISEDAKQPLAFHPLLLKTARGHSDWMLDKDIFSHTGSDGSASTTPTMRAAKNGYEFSVAENIDWEGTSSSPDYNKFTVMAHENFFGSPSHRPNLMDPSFSVVGLGMRTGDFIDPNDGEYYINTLMTTQNFSSGGDSDDSGPFLVGVVYKDLNSNGAYDPGEGLPDVRVEPNFGGYYAITSTSGGYAVPIPPLETVSEDYDIRMPIFDDTTLDDIRPHDEEFRRLKIENAVKMIVNITWSGQNVSQAKQSFVTIRRPVRINYHLIGSNKGHYESTMVTSMNVKADLQLLPRINSQPRSLVVVAGSFARFDVMVSGFQHTYQWFRNGIPITGATGSVFNISNVKMADAGHYSVSVRNSDGQLMSRVAKLTVTTPKITSNLSSVTLKPNKLMIQYALKTNFGAKSFSAKGLPVGLKLNATTGIVSGKPSKKGTYTVTFTAEKKQGMKIIQRATAKKVFKVS